MTITLKHPLLDARSAVEAARHYDQFLAWLEPRREHYAGARLGLAAYRRDRDLQNLYCRIVLTAEPARLSRFEVEGDGLYVEKRPMTIDSAFAAILSFGRLAVRLDDVSVGVRRLQPPGDYAFYYQEPAPALRAAVGWPTVSLFATGDAIGEIVGAERHSSLRRRLPGKGRRQFANWEQLGSFLGAPESAFNLESRGLAVLECYAPIYARLRDVEVELRSGKVTGFVDASGDPSRRRLKVLIAPDPSVEPATEIPPSRWQAAQRGTWRFESVLRRGLGEGLVQLRLAGEAVDEVKVGAPSPASSVHASLDPEMRWLRRLLRPSGEKKETRGLEDGVVALLSLAGIATVHYGHKSGNNFPDLVGWVGAGLCVVGECVDGPPDDEKISTLHSRAGLVKGAAPEGTKVVEALFCRTPSAAVSAAARQHAERVRVAIVAESEIEQLLQAVRRGEPAAKVLGLLWDFAILSPSQRADGYSGVL
jgi:hypothetical protein